MLADGTISLVVTERTPESRPLPRRPGRHRPQPAGGQPAGRAALGGRDERRPTGSTPSGPPRPGSTSSACRSSARPVEVKLLKELLRTRGSPARVVAKIEKREAIDNLESIVEAADAVMVARGDLGVETDVASMPMVQKRIIRACQRYQKPVIVATQMLDSMQHARRPTRAEATDVANAILDGADACMLSGETAIGEHPRLVVEMMRRIARETEKQYLADRWRYMEGRFMAERGTAGVPVQEFLPSPEFLVDGLHPITQAVVDGASRIAGELDAKLFVVASRVGPDGDRPLEAAGGRADGGPLRQPGHAPADVALLGRHAAGRRRPRATPPPCSSTSAAGGCGEGRLQRGDRILLVAGSGFGTGGHNMALVHEV